MSVAELPEELITLVQVLAGDDKLRAWFEQVGRARTGSRIAEFQRMAIEMEAGGEDAALVSAVRLLADRRIYQGACAALKVARRQQ